MARQCRLVHHEAQEVNCEVKVRQNTTFILPFIHSFIHGMFVYNARHSLPSLSVNIKAYLTTNVRYNRSV